MIQFPVKPLNDLRIRFGGVVLVAILRLGLMVEVWAADSVNWWLVLENTLLAGLIIWEASRAVVVYSHRHRPLSQFTARQYWWEALLLLLVTGGIYTLRLIIYLHLVDQEPVPFVYYLFGLFYTYLYGILVAGFYELLLYMEAWKKSNQEAEQLKKANLISQLDSLKDQVKPHFLFNSLNTLTALVEKDPTQAVRFIAELSKVYRYLLQSSEKELISVAGELQFVEAYFYLLQTRFGRGIALTVEGVEPYAHYLMPPLTLQMLLENTVKHNQVSVDKPLRVGIEVQDGQWLAVTNNVQHRRISVPTSGLGLTNITAKYRLLNQPDVQIVSDSDWFVVRVPLIQPFAS